MEEQLAPPGPSAGGFNSAGRSVRGGSLAQPATAPGQRALGQLALGSPLPVLPSAPRRATKRDIWPVARFNYLFRVRLSIYAVIKQPWQ